MSVYVSAYVCLGECVFLCVFHTHTCIQTYSSKLTYRHTRVVAAIIYGFVGTDKSNDFDHVAK